MYVCMYVRIYIYIHGMFINLGIESGAYGKVPGQWFHTILIISVKWGHQTRQRENKQFNTTQ